MELRRLRYFIAIVEEGTISLAAKRLHMAQPPLSQQLKILEDELGVTLFERHTRKLILTEEGQFFYAQCLQILDLVNATQTSLNAFQHGLSGTLKIGTIASLGAAILPPNIKAFQQLYPHVTFQMWEGDPNRVMELVEKRVVDIGLVRLPIDEERFASLPLHAEPLVAVMTDAFLTSKHAITLDELASVPLLILRRHAGTSSYNDAIYSGDLLRQAFSVDGLTPHIICESSDMTTLLAWAQHGIGVAVVPQSATTLLERSTLHIVPLSTPIYTRPATVIWLKERHMNPVATKFCAFFNR